MTPQEFIEEVGGDGPLRGGILKRLQWVWSWGFDPEDALQEASIVFWRRAKPGLSRGHYFNFLLLLANRIAIGWKRRAGDREKNLHPESWNHPEAKDTTRKAECIEAIHAYLKTQPDIVRRIYLLKVENPDMTYDEIVAALEVSTATVKRYWPAFQDALRKWAADNDLIKELGQ